jgi:Type II secretion system (T2SS), protein E, N-terminal domain
VIADDKRSETTELGEILIEEGWVAAGDVAQAVADRAQLGVRLASLLVGRGLLAPDDAARALSRQHGVPAVLLRHFAARDPGLASRLTCEFAHEWMAMPLLIARDGSVVVCVRDPHRNQLRAQLERQLRLPVTLAVACAAVLESVLREGFGPAVDVDIEVSEAAGAGIVIAGLSSAARADLGRSDPFESHSLRLAALDDEEVARGPTDGAGTGISRWAEPSRSTAPPQRWATALDAMAQAHSRDQVVDAAFSALQARWSAAVLFSVKAEAALAQRGFGGMLRAEAIDTVVIPLHSASIVRTAWETRQLSTSSVSSAVQDRLLRLLASDCAAAAPVVVAGRVVAVIAAAAPHADPGASQLLELCGHLGSHLARIIRAAKRENSR